MEQLKKLFESFDGLGKIYLDMFMMIIFEIEYKERVFDFSKISYDDSLEYGDPDDAPKKYTKFEKRMHTTFFRYTDNEQEFKCKLLEWLSRPATKEGDINTQRWYLEGINKYLGTNFTNKDIDDIYCHLGNEVSRSLTFKFIESGYDMEVLEDLCSNCVFSVYFMEMIDNEDDYTIIDDYPTCLAEEITSKEIAEGFIEGYVQALGLDYEGSDMHEKGDHVICLEVWQYEEPISQVIYKKKE